MTGLPTSDDPRPGAHADGDPRLLELGWKHVYSGKVRELYVKDDEPGRVLVVASDRVSAFDHVLEPAIPGKGAMLTQLSMWWFRRLGVPHHLVAAHPALGEHLPEGIAERAMHVHELDMLPIEAVVRGYLVGSGWAEYRESQTVCGLPLRAHRRAGRRRPRRGAARAQPRHLPHRVGDRLAARADPGRHEVRVRPRPRGRRRPDPRRRGADQRLEPLLGRGGVRRGR